jgi:tetratricopeptide (TPR) repeat protein
VAGGSALSRPGKKKLAGDTLCDELMPLHPAARIKRAAHAANCNHLPLILTLASIRQNMLCAIFNSRGGQPGALACSRGKTGPYCARRLLPWLLFIASYPASARFFAADTNQNPAPLTRSDFAARAKKAYVEASNKLQSETNSVEAAWEFGRACFDWADFAAKNSERAVIAGEGIAACRDAIARGPKSAPAHYYLGMNLGELAQTKGLGGLKIVKEMEREFQTVKDLDEPFDYAGPDRNLGLLYRDAPTVFSVGSRTKALEHLRRAVELAPEYPENRLNLIETLLKWNERDDARVELAAAEKIWPKARAEFSGEAWEPGWLDWEARLKRIRTRMQQKPVQSPRHLD